MYTMRQVMYPADTSWTEHFFDGEVRVVNNEVTFDREHWKDALYQRGFIEVVLENEEVVEASNESDTPETVEKVPKKRGRPRKEVKS